MVQLSTSTRDQNKLNLMNGFGCICGHQTKNIILRWTGMDSRTDGQESVSEGLGSNFQNNNLS